MANSHRNRKNTLKKKKNLRNNESVNSRKY